MLESPAILFEIDSPLTTEEVVIRLQSVTRPRPVIRFRGAWGRQQNFEGLVTESWYELHRVLEGRNSFNPRVTGQVKAVDGRALLSGTMALDAFVMPFLGFFTGCCGVMLAGMLVVQALLMRFAMWTFIPAMMLTASLVAFLKIPGFVSEARTTAQRLAKVVDATRVQLYAPPSDGRWRFIAGIRELEGPLRGDRHGAR